MGGGYKVLSTKELADCEKLGKYLAGSGYEIQTGGGTGYPYAVGKAAVQSGARVFGRSPAISQAEHIEKFHFKMDGCTDYIYVTKKFDTPAEGLIARMQDMQPFSDLVIAMGGTWGTLYELTLSLYFRKTIILITGFKGATKVFRDAHRYFGKGNFNPVIHQGAKIITVKTVDEAIQEMAKLST